jgi:hypothetical protein
MPQLRGNEPLFRVSFLINKTKHIPIKFHFLLKQVREKNIKLEYIQTKEHIADIFTKPLPRERFEYLR